ncbi:DUF7133 domain-containing protein [Pleomorphovibrio marinus]|uniref:DUF7133 domain-containing protein n=1 Tax=Pleomorphovibrio marinus TaxID=2164132 RepID=UPI001E4AD572|nr:HEAT repeat domain-containing protein [Pleomorphovibrio marinus]
MTGCQKEAEQSEADRYAASPEVADYIRSFEGRGDLTDPSSQPSTPEATLASFSFAKDLEISLVLSEPDIQQPLEIQFDHKGRLWVVQYNQYPYPEGVKITAIDNHNRVKFDKIPEAPPSGVKGADKITFFEDTNGDGYYDKATDAIAGLNIATSVALGRGKIWVLNPPYLLAYPDRNDDGIPDGDPEVCVNGFGLEDTHSVANSLHWGPDGWLYGVNGSTTTASITTANTKDLSFTGQAIWRYHPERKSFEIFAEGGGNNPFSIEFDSEGRLYSGSNGYGRGPYYKQGAYYIKSWGKHGPLTNPFAFGYLENMPLEGEKKRFTHGLVKYEGHSLPQHYQGKMFSVNPLHGYIQLSRFETWGSSFKNIDEEVILGSTDKWFRPIDIKVGPDGAIYISDWYDSRLSHVDPRDTWHKESGRIYRISARGNDTNKAKVDLSQLSSLALVEYLSHPNKWQRQQALRLLGDRRDMAVLPELSGLLKTQKGQTALEALWTIYQINGLSTETLKTGLAHTNPMVRKWTIRLLGDEKTLSAETASLVIQLLEKETHSEVRSQILSTCKRIPAEHALPIMARLLEHGDEDAKDPDLPLQYWWALSAQARQDITATLTFILDPKVRDHPIVEQTLLPRLSQQWAMQGEKEHYKALVSLLENFNTQEHRQGVTNGILEGMRGKDTSTLPSYLKDAFEKFGAEANPLFIGMEEGSTAIKRAEELLRDEGTSMLQKNQILEQLAYLPEEKGKGLLLEVSLKSPSAALQRTAIHSLTYYADKEIGEAIADAYPQLRADSYIREAMITLFTTRKDWAYAFFEALEDKRTIHKEDVPLHLALKFTHLDDPVIHEKVTKNWPEFVPLGQAEKNRRIKAYKNIMAGEKGDAILGKSIYRQNCAACHVLHGEGGDIGPELTGYDRGDLDYLLLHTVNPSADIREGYETQVVKMKSGSVFSGKVVDERGDLLTLAPPHGGKSFQLSLIKVKDRALEKRSTMPERLLEGLSDQELLALFTYLME